MSVVKSTSLRSSASNENRPTSSCAGLTQLRMCSTARCPAVICVVPRMLPLTSKRMPRLIGPWSLALNWTICRSWPRSKTWKSSRPRLLTGRPRESRTTAVTETTSTAARKDGVCARATPVVAGWRPIAAITIAAVHIRANRVSRRLTGPPYFNDPANRHKSPLSGHLSVLAAGSAGLGVAAGGPKMVKGIPEHGL